jgi:chromosome segregation ATPase
MLNLFKNIFKSKKNSSTNNSGYHHLKKIISGPKVIIDGKVFVKVKLRFVDTLDFNITRFVDRLETEIESQKLEIERLTSVLADNEKLISDLQSLNINLLHDNRTMPARLNEKISNLTSESHNKSQKVTSLQNECVKLKEKIYLLNAQIVKSQNLMIEKNNRIKSLEHTISGLRVSDKGIKTLVDSNAKLRKDLKSLESRHKSVVHESEQKDSLNKLLTKKILNHEMTIYMLETKILEKEKQA